MHRVYSVSPMKGYILGNNHIYLKCIAIVHLRHTLVSGVDMV